MKIRHFVLLAGLICATWLGLFADNTSVNGISESVKSTVSSRTRPVTTLTNRVTNETQKKETQSISLLTLIPRSSLIGNQDFKRPVIDLFASNNWTPPPPPPPKPLPPPPPVAPPLPFTFIGKKLEAGVWEIYLSKNDQVIIAKPKMTVEGLYRIDRIDPPNMSFVYLPLNQVQTLSIGVAE